MESLLVVTTIASLLLAATMTAVALRLERARRARVEALKQVAFAGDGAFETTPPAAAIEIRRRRVEASDRGAQAPATFPASRATDAPAMFAAVDEPPAPARRWVSFASVAGVMLVVLSTIAVLHDPVAAPSEAVERQAAAAASPAASVPSVALVALRHDVDSSGRLTVAGVARNATSTVVLRGVRIVVTAFDRDGRRLGSREEPLALTGIAPDSASAFEATLTGVQGVARYDVAFRGADGSTLPHLDRRADRGVVRR